MKSPSLFALVFSLTLILAKVTFADMGNKTCASTFDGLKTLNLVNPKKSKLKNPVQVQWNMDEKNLIVHFDVNTPVQHEKKKFGQGDYPFNYDVVEVFVAVNDPKDKAYAYYEFEITPNKQRFDVKINVAENGKKTSESDIDVGAEATAERTDKRWSGMFSIPLEKLGWKGDLSFVRGNFYAIIGKKPNRTYWSTFLPQQDKAQFHLPEHFKPLFECK